MLKLYKTLVSLGASVTAITAVLALSGCNLADSEEFTVDDVFTIQGITQELPADGISSTSFQVVLGCETPVGTTVGISTSKMNLRIADDDLLPTEVTHATFAAASRATVVELVSGVEVGAGLITINIGDFTQTREIRLTRSLPASLHASTDRLQVAANGVDRASVTVSAKSPTDGGTVSKGTEIDLVGRLAAGGSLVAGVGGRFTTDSSGKIEADVFSSTEGATYVVATVVDNTTVRDSVLIEFTAP